LKGLYDQLADRFIGGVDTIDQAWVEQWRKDMQIALGENAAMLDKIFGAFGIDASQAERSATSKGIASMSQDSANELNGNFYALRQQVGDIRNMQKEANVQRAAIYTALLRVQENTEFCRLLVNVKNSLEDIQLRGLKMKV
jgi:hypothetical protein